MCSIKKDRFSRQRVIIMGNEDGKKYRNCYLTLF